MEFVVVSKNDSEGQRGGIYLIPASEYIKTDDEHGSFVFSAESYEEANQLAEAIIEISAYQTTHSR